MKQLLFTCRSPPWTHYPPPPPPPTPPTPPWDHWGHPGNCHEQLLILHIRRYKLLHNLIVQLLYLKKMLLWNLHGFGPWEPSPWVPHGGHMYHMNDFESSVPNDDSCQVCLKSSQAFSRSRWNSYFLHRAPSPTCYPHRGHWDHPGNCHE